MPMPGILTVGWTTGNITQGPISIKLRYKWHNRSAKNLSKCVFLKSKMEFMVLTLDHLQVFATSKFITNFGFLSLFPPRARITIKRPSWVLNVGQ